MSNNDNCEYLISGTNNIWKHIVFTTTPGKNNRQ